MNELNTASVYDNTSDLYKSLGYCLLDESEQYPIHTFQDLSDSLVNAIIDSNKYFWNTVANIKDVFKTEYKTERLSDIPILECTDYLFSVIDSYDLTESQQSTRVDLEKCIENAIREGVEELIEECGFNPNPYGPYMDCPYDVMGRNVTRGLIQLDEAETDEEIAESLIHLGRMSVAMEQQFQVDDTGTMMKISPINEGLFSHKQKQPTISEKEMVSKLPSIIKATTNNNQTCKKVGNILLNNLNKSKKVEEDGYFIGLIKEDHWRKESDWRDRMSEDVDMFLKELDKKLYVYGYRTDMDDTEGVLLLKGAKFNSKYESTMEGSSPISKIPPKTSPRVILTSIPFILDTIGKNDRSLKEISSRALDSFNKVKSKDYYDENSYNEFVSNNREGELTIFYLNGRWYNYNEPDTFAKFCSTLTAELYKHGYSLEVDGYEGAFTIIKGATKKEPTMESSSVSKKARELSRKANKKEAKVISKVGGTIKEVGKAGKEAISPMEKFINNATTKIKEADKNERRNIIVKGGMVPKVWRWIKRSIPLVIGGAIGATVSPVAVTTAIAFIGWVATDKFLDRRERAKLLRELEDEIQIVNEKIDDSRGDDNKQKKYELMRIRNDLKRTQDKIKLGLKY